MGDLQIWAPQPNGFSIEDQLFTSSSISSFPSSSNPNPLSISDDCWLIAEQTTQEIICQIQPTLVSEQRRKVVIEYVQRLIRGYLGSEVFPFGSVPLKTYLPDGDIDLTALSFQNVEDALANDVRLVLEGEEQNNAAEFEVKDVQYIHAEVKLVKCLVQNIVVDISFNQIGGLCTLCFLEQVDQLIGKDHLFKRSIILIKAWCYYESRILGAHHGLISTYALETLVLYIFHLFHSSLNGPLAVLYRFLDYYSKFDWDNYCISLNGPVSLSSLPEIVADTPENGGDDLLLTQDFLRNCGEMFSVPSKGLESNSRAFLQKHLNIVDPLKENNNLGRSVSKGNFYRIRSAFTYGARKLGRILLLPEGSVVDDLNKFFLNTLDRHGGGQRPDVQDPIPTGSANGSNPESSMSGVEKCTKSTKDFGSTADNSSCTAGESMLDPPGLLSNGICEVRISETEQNHGHRTANEPDRYTTKADSSSTVSETNGPLNGNAVSGYRLVGDAKDLATTRSHVPRIITKTTKSTSSSSESDASPLAKPYADALPLARPFDEPHLYFSHSFPANGKISSGKLDQTKTTNSSIGESKASSSSMLQRLPEEQNGLFPQQSPEETKQKTSDAMYSRCDQNGSITSGSTEGLLASSPGANISEDLCNSYREGDPTDTGETPGALSTLSDLRGDYDSHFKSLLYGQWCHEYGFCGSVMSIPPPSPAQFRNKHGWDSFHRPMPLKRNVFPHMNANGVVSGPQFYSANPSMISGAAFGVEEMPKPRGTGTYFPNTNHRSYKDRSLPGKGRNPGPVSHSGHLQRPPRENGWVVTHPETNMHEIGSRESPTQRHFPVLSARGKHEQGEFFQAGRPGMRGFSHSNGFSLPDKLEFGTFGHPPLGTPPPDLSRQSVSSAPQTQVSTSSLPTPTAQRPKPSLTIDTERIAVQSYHLRDDDFPPLSV